MKPCSDVNGLVKLCVLCRVSTVQWQSAAVAGDSPAAREFHTLSALSDGRILLFGGLPLDPARHAPPHLALLHFQMAFVLLFSPCTFCIAHFDNHCMSLS